MSLKLCEQLGTRTDLNCLFMQKSGSWCHAGMSEFNVITLQKHLIMMLRYALLKFVFFAQHHVLSGESAASLFTVQS